MIVGKSEGDAPVVAPDRVGEGVAGEEHIRAGIGETDAPGA